MKVSGEEAPRPSEDEMPVVVPTEVGEELQLSPWANDGSGKIGFVPSRGQNLDSISSGRTDVVTLSNSSWRKSP